MKNECYQTISMDFSPKKSISQRDNLILRLEIVEYMKYLRVNYGSVYVETIAGFIRFRNTSFERKVKR